MKFGPETINLLVRPRILTSGRILILGAKEQSSFSLFSLKPSFHNITPFAEPETLFGKSFGALFSGLVLGDMASDTHGYVAKIVAYLVKIGSTMKIVNLDNINETLALVKNRFGKRTKLKIVSVGVTFFQEFERGEELKPLKPWIIRTKSGHETIWFYKPWDLVPMTEIIKFESVQLTDLVIFQKSSGLVVEKKQLNKPKFYQTSSWSSYSIKLLSQKGESYVRFIPNRAFSVKKT